MCGIAGIFTFRGCSSDLESELLMRSVTDMTETLTHRGPDSSGYFFSGNLGNGASLNFGHRRLKILDLSDNGHQPMSNEDETLQIIHNGEIYNYVELRKILIEKEHIFRSQTDTEVIIHAYEEWGVDCVERFNGMWAFALWDSRKQRLLLSRDRFGIKPLYYFFNGDCIVFASEIKSLLAGGFVKPEPNYNWIYTFLTKAAVDWDETTAFKSILSLSPGHNLLVFEDGRLEKTRYWTLAPKETDQQNPVEQFYELLNDSVRLRSLRSDVPVGSCLSGGIDSSSIVALASAFSENTINTYSAQYHEPEYSEQYFVDLVSNKFPVHIHTIIPTADDFWETIRKIIWFQDEPTPVNGIYSQWFLFQEAQKKVRVMLDGQGGDELLGGYHYFFEAYLIDELNRFLENRNQTAFNQFQRVYEDIRNLTGIDFFPRLKRSYFQPPKGEDVLQEDFCDDVYRRHPPDLRFARQSTDEVNNTLYWALMRTSLPALLHYEDRNSMAFSVEARLPFLDYRLVEFCFSLPGKWKMQGTTTKRLLREAMGNVLPDELVNRRDKMGFATPMGNWFRSDLFQRIEDLFSSQSFIDRGIMDHKKVLEKFHRHAAGEVDHYWEIWRWMNLEIWFREFIDNRQ